MANLDIKQPVLSYDGAYCDVVRVALYLRTYGTLPPNYITKTAAKSLGWVRGSLEPYAPGRCIGGDRYYNRSRALPTDIWYECDIDTLGASDRGQKRIVYSADCSHIYYTADHYLSFVQLMCTAPEPSKSC